jgi:hypothetical protein
MALKFCSFIHYFLSKYVKDRRNKKLEKTFKYLIISLNSSVKSTSGDIRLTENIKICFLDWRENHIK